MSVLVLFSSIAIFLVCYHVTYNDMIAGLTDRVFSIYNYLENSLNKSTFAEIQERGDTALQNYQVMKRLLESVRDATGVRYLYTAKENDNGQLIYVVDGLDAGAPDFRYPGDPIEPEIQEDMRRALGGRLVLPDNIKKTDWGKIFITYLPIHDGERVIGVLGIEFEAEHQYNTYLALRGIVPAVIIVFCVVSTVFAVFRFRRISNPSYRDMSNTDQLTQLRSRNAFEVDIANLTARQHFHRIGILAVDLNELKRVNDTLGHEAGDRYIQYAAQALKAAADKKEAIYRTGGDEFIVLLCDTSADELQCRVRRIHDAFLANRPEELGDTALSVGFALYDESLDEDIRSVCRRADADMYANKRAYKEGKMRG